MNIDVKLIHQYLEKSAQKYPRKEAVIDRERRVAYGELNHASSKLASFLTLRGIGKGALVPLMFENSAEYIISYFGILKAGAVAVPLGTDLRPDSLLFYLQELEPDLIIASGRFERLLNATDLKTPGLTDLILSKSSLSWKEQDLNLYDFDEIVDGTDQDSHVKTVEIHPDDYANIIYTSGSTGHPKGVMLTHRNIVENTESICTYLKLDHHDIQMVVLPFFYVMGLSLLNTHVCVGGTLVINNTFAYPATVIQQMIDEKVTGFSGVPSTYAYLLHRSPLKARREELKHLRYCSQAGGHMAAHLKKGLREILPEHTDIYIMYGATEASARLAYLAPDQLEKKMESIGKAIPGVELDILDKDGKKVPNGTVGELVAKGPNIMAGYFKDSELTAKKLSPAGYHTGDLCFCDEDGYIFLTGRKDDLVKVGGHRVNPQEVEDTLMDSDLVIEVVAAGVPDPLMGHHLYAVAVKDNDSCTEAELLQYCNRILPRYKHPEKIFFVRSIPKKANGKIDRMKCIEIIDKRLTEGEKVP